VNASGHKLRNCWPGIVAAWWAWGAPLPQVPDLQGASTRSQIPIVVEHNAPREIRSRPGDRVPVAMWLRVVGRDPVQISHGSRLFVLQARFISSHVSHVGPVSFPQAMSWGATSSLEYPNPNAAYTTAITLKTLDPGEHYPNPPTMYRVPVDSSGTYLIRICADLSQARICADSGVVISSR